MNHGQLATVLLLIVGATAVGCRELSTDYGQSRGYVGRTSLNGFGALRHAYENAGFESRDATRLSDRVTRTDTIVWTPQIHGPVDHDATAWFDRWLSAGGKTLVYILPDSGSEVDYWQTAARLADPKQRLEYRKRVAKGINRRMIWRMNRASVQHSGWFDVQPTLSHIDPMRLKDNPSAGLWANALGTDDNAAQTRLSTELSISTTDPDSEEDPTTVNLFELEQTGPTPPTFPYPIGTGASEVEVVIQPLVNNQQQMPVVAQVVAEDWVDSKIIVVAGGSLLTNYAFTRTFNRKLADQIVRASQYDDGDRVAFITTPWSLIAVSDSEPGIPQATGMELLTVWPISLITMHGIMIVLIIGLTLLPIFGRPKRIVASSQRDFGDHLDAVAALMNKAGGEAYARERIAEYRKRIHGEHATIADSTSPNLDEEAS